MTENNLLNDIKKARFRKNNGRVFRGINLFHGKYISLGDLKLGLARDITDKEYCDSVNYLYEAGYIHLRNKKSRKNTTFADADIDLLEAMLNAKGIQLANEAVTDPCIEL